MSTESTKVPFQKPAFSFKQQLDKLASRGLIVTDEQKCLTSLSSISYYRLSAYCYPFRQRTHKGILSKFETGTTFSHVIKLYDFDRELRLLVMDAIERIEITVRARINHDLTLKYGVFAHAESANFHPKFKHSGWIKGVQTEVERSSDEFIVHFKKKYNDYPLVPLWSTTEVMSLGKLSYMYKGLLPEDKKTISQYFGIPSKRLENWLHVITYVRNICAHHSRLWNRALAIRPNKTKDLQWLPPITPRNDRIFYILLILRFLMRASENGEHWKLHIEALIEPFSCNEAFLAGMGIPKNWKEHPVWNKKAF